MAKSKRLAKSFLGLLFPVFILLIAAFLVAAIWLVHISARPPVNDYLVTPEKYGLLSSRGARVREEKWANRDGTQTRGWLLPGAENQPAVIMLHHYGADRSHLLDLGVKLNEATNFTILMIDLRGHGVNPLVKNTSFGGCETDDILSAIDFLRGLKTEAQTPLVGKSIGIYGVELGAISALSAAAKNESIKSLILDSLPENSDQILASSVAMRFPAASSITSKIAQAGTYPYFYDGCYNRDSTCETAKMLKNKQVLLLAGADAPLFQDSTAAVAKCFPQSVRKEIKTDLNPSGYTVITSSLELSETYHRKIIEFFSLSLTDK